MSAREVFDVTPEWEIEVLVAEHLAEVRAAQARAQTEG
jgi:hypothetical protein